MRETAIEIIKKHTAKPDADYSESWVMEFAKEIAELAFRAGDRHGEARYLVTTSPDLNDFMKELFKP